MSTELTGAGRLRLIPRPGSLDDLAMLVRRLVRALKNSGINSELQTQAINYLKRCGLDEESLRRGAADSAPRSWRLVPETETSPARIMDAREGVVITVAVVTKANKPNLELMTAAPDLLAENERLRARVAELEAMIKA